jgi:lipopolysaccharide export system permease protein
VKKLHAFIFKSFAGPMVLTFFIVTFLLQMQFLWKYIDDLVGKGLTIMVIGKLLLYASATFVPLALPLAVLLASLMTFGSLGENFELTAIKSAGISLTRIMKPLIVLIIAIAISAFFYSNYSMPYFTLKMRSLLFDIQQQRPELSIKEGVYTSIDNYVIKVGKKDSKTNLMYKISIYDHSANNGNVGVTIADSGYMIMTSDKRNLEITLFKGESYIDMIENDRNFGYNKRTYPFRRDKFSKQVINIPIAGFELQRTDEGLFRGNFQMLNIKQLQLSIDSMYTELHKDKSMLQTLLIKSNYNQTVMDFPLDTSKKAKADSLPKIKNLNIRVMYYMLSDMEKINTLSSALDDARNSKNAISNEATIHVSKIGRLRRHEIEWHKKFTLSFACIIFFFIGAPLGAIIRKGGLGLPLVISVLFFILYYIISLSGEKLVRGSHLDPYLGIWMASLILLPLGAFLTVKATNDSTVLNLDSYLKVFRMISGHPIWKKIFDKKQK